MCLQPTSPPPATGKTLFYHILCCGKCQISALMPGGGGDRGEGVGVLQHTCQFTYLHVQPGALANVSHAAIVTCCV